MPSIYDIKPAFQRLLAPVMRALHGVGITPNQVTLLALLLSFAGGWFVWQSLTQPLMLLGIPLILFVRMALNAIDGMLARTYNQQSALGEILNEVGDVLADIVLYLPLFIPALAWVGMEYAQVPALLSIPTFVFLAALSELVGVLGKAMTGTRRYEGPMGKSDRAFFAGLYCVVAAFWPAVNAWAGWIFVGGCVLLLLTIANRGRRILAESRGRGA